MRFEQRSYLDETDKQIMLTLAQMSVDHTIHAVDLPYRLSSWALDEPDNVRLWFNKDGNLTGWAILQTPFWAIDYVCHPSLEAELHPEILAWADQRAQEIIATSFGHPTWYVMVFDEQEQRIHDLEAAGFHSQLDVGEDSWSQVMMQRPASLPLNVYQPPSGYTVRSLEGESEVEAYVELHRSVFMSKNMTEEWRRRTLQHPQYRPDLDVVVASPQGQLVAFCVCWFDESSATAQIEPLGCHPDFRKYALGRVALSHALQRLQALGAQNIFVETDSYRNTAFRLYEFFDFQVSKNILVYRKDYAK